MANACVNVSGRGAVGYDEAKMWNKQYMCCPLSFDFYFFLPSFVVTKASDV